MSSLTLPASSKPIDSLEDLISSDAHKLVIENGSIIQSIFENSKDPLFKAVWNKVKRQGLQESIFTPLNYSVIMKNQGFVMGHDLSYIHLRVRLEFSTKNGESLLHPSKHGVYPSGLGIPMRKNAPYTSAVNKW